MKPQKTTKTITEAEFLESYDTLATPLFRHIYFRIGDRERALELSQDAFVKAWQYISQGREVLNLKAFLYTIARHLIVDEYRKPGRISLDMLREEEKFDIPDLLESAKTVAQAELNRAIEAINVLPAKYKEAILMRYVEDMTPTEIAEATGLSENVISVRINRAIKKLKEVTKHE